MTINKKFKFQKGASSVMVIFLLIILTTLGAFTIVSSRVNYKFSNEVSTWNKEFYKVDDQVEEFTFEFDKILSNSEISALKYMENENFENTNSELTNIFEETYLDYVKENINKLLEDYPNIFVEYEDNKISVENNFYGNEKINIALELEIKPVKYSFVFDDENITARRVSKEQRFSVVQRKEWQEEIEYDNEITLWDGN